MSCPARPYNFGHIFRKIHTYGHPLQPITVRKCDWCGKRVYRTHEQESLLTRKVSQ